MRNPALHRIQVLLLLTLGLASFPVVASEPRNIETVEEFDRLLQQEEALLVDFWAAWCAPCRMLAPLLKELAAEYSGELTILKVDIDEFPELAQRYQVNAIPDLRFFRQGSEAGQILGFRPKPDLDAAIRETFHLKESHNE